MSDEKKTGVPGAPLDDSVPSETPSLLQRELGLDRRRTIPATPGPFVPSSPLGAEYAPTVVSPRRDVGAIPGPVPSAPTSVPATSPFAKTVASATNPVLAKIQATERQVAERLIAERAQQPLRPPVPTSAMPRANPPQSPGVAQALRAALGSRPISPAEMVTDPITGARVAAAMAARPGSSQLKTDPLHAPDVVAALARGPSVPPGLSPRIPIDDPTRLTRAPPPPPQTDATQVTRGPPSPALHADPTSVMRSPAPTAPSSVAIPPPPPRTSSVAIPPPPPRSGAAPGRPIPVGSPRPPLPSAHPTLPAAPPRPPAPPPAAPLRAAPPPPASQPIAAAPPRPAPQPLPLAPPRPALVPPASQPIPAAPRGAVQAMSAAPPGVPMPSSVARTQLAPLPISRDERHDTRPERPQVTSARPVPIRSNAVQVTVTPPSPVSQREVMAQPVPRPSPPRAIVPEQPPPRPMPVTTPSRRPVSYEDLPPAMEAPRKLGPEFATTQPGVAGPYSKPLSEQAWQSPTQTVEQAARPQFDPEQTTPDPDDEVLASDQVLANVAPVWRRSCSWLLDLAVIAGLAGALLFLAVNVIGGKPVPPSLHGVPAFIFRLKPIALPGAAIAIGFAILYTTLFAFLLEGRTLGRLLLGIRLVDSSGKAPGLGRAFFRAIFALVSFALFLSGFWLALFDRRGQTLHDKLTRTFVIRPV